jgi:PGF-CTERM protein
VATQTATAHSAEGPTVYVGSRDGTQYAVDAASGTEGWAFTRPSDRVFSSPTVVANPQDGDSVGLRMRLGTLGHHGNRAEGRIGSGDYNFNDGNGGDNSNGGDGGDGFSPGFVVGGAVVGLSSAGYLLKRRLDDEDPRE